MPDRTSNGMQCQEFDNLLTDALDGVLSGSALDRFQDSRRQLPGLRPLLAEAEAGRNWLKGLTEVEASSEPGQQYPGIHDGRPRGDSELGKTGHGKFLQRKPSHY